DCFMISSVFSYCHFVSSQFNCITVILIRCESECETVAVVPVSAFYHLCDFKSCAAFKSSFSSVNIVKCCFACYNRFSVQYKLAAGIILDNFISYCVLVVTVCYARNLLFVCRNNFPDCQLICTGLSKLDVTKDYI